MDENDQKLLAWDEALKQIGGSEDILRSVAHTFLESCPQMMDDIRKSAEAGDAKELRRAAHTLKGSVAIFGAKPAHDVSLALERLAREGELDGVPAAIERVETEIERLLPVMKNHLET